MRSSVVGWALAVLGLPMIAGASSISDELAVGTQQPTANNPRSGYVSDRLSGLVDLSDHFDLRGDITVTDDLPTPRQPGTAFPSSGGVIPLFTLGADWNPNDHWSFGGEVSVSPASSQSADAPLQLTFDGGTFLADADLRSTASSVGAAVLVGYDTAGESDFETTLTGAVAVTRLDSTQRIAAISDRSLNNLYAAVEALCRKPVTARLKGCQALAGQTAALTQTKVSGSVFETLFEDTDLGLTFAYYLYDRDPTQVGYYTLTNAGRTRSTSFGEGVPIAPLQFTVRPEVGHRFGGLRATLFYQYGQYVPGQGDSNGGGLKVEYKFSKTFKAWVSASAEHDVDGTGNATESGSAALGARVRF